MPLSDVALTQQLAASGILLARRTVSKYRGQLRMPPAELRRRH
jgi:RNA polymerase sigma-54 factor